MVQTDGCFQAASYNSFRDAHEVVTGCPEVLSHSRSKHVNYTCCADQYTRGQQRPELLIAAIATILSSVQLCTVWRNLRQGAQ